MVDSAGGRIGSAGAALGGAGEWVGVGAGGSKVGHPSGVGDGIRSGSGYEGHAVPVAAVEPGGGLVAVRAAGPVGR